MSRQVNPYLFNLRAASLIEAARQQKTNLVRDRFFGGSTGNFPVALRWSTSSEVGFPREPFQVFRRARLTADLAGAVSVLSAPVALAGIWNVLVVANGDSAYLATASVLVAAGSSITVQALDASLRGIPGEQVTLSTNGTAQFRCPGMTLLQFTGTGTISAVRAVGQNAYANLADWKRLQTVGLPLTNGEIGAAYNTAPQGFEPPALDGVAAAELRTTMTTLLQLQPGASGLPDLPVPAWPVPDPNQYVQNLRGGNSLMPMIERCLEKSDDANLLKMQSLYTEQVTLDGIKQANLAGATPDPTRPTQATLPVTSLAMLTVSTDSYSAVGLGYGTVDLPPFVPAPTAPVAIVVVNPTLPSIDPIGDWDYMVTAPFVFPFGAAMTLAALSSGQPPVDPPASLLAVVKQVHTPISRDTAAPAAIGVSWETPTTPQGYGILVSRAPNSSEVLNTPRPTAVGGYDPFLGIPPVSSDSSTPPDLLKPGFTDTECVLPLKAPSINTRYLVAGLDVFGLWSGWSLASAPLSPASIAMPGVRSAQFLLDTAHATGHVVPATLQIDFGWDWEDRSPGVLRFGGQFVAAPATGLGPTAIAASLQMKPGAMPGAAALLTFSYANAGEAATVQPAAKIPVIDGVHTVAEPVAVLKTADFDPNKPQVTYRVEITGFTLDFTSVTEIDFALYATAAEFIRPGEWSAPTDNSTRFIGALVRSFDPFPPVVQFTPPSISWTALPDATGKARGILQWVADPKATGYYVWEATESALLHILAPATPDPAPNTPLVMRGSAVKALILANQAASLQGFARLNDEPIPGSRTEIVVPSAASTLYVYRISAISAGNVEAARSDQVAIFGVPRRNVPGTPRVLLRPATAPLTGMQVIALPVQSGAPPAGYRVFRVRSQALSHDGSTMGPAKISDSAPGWTAYAGTSLKGSPLPGKSAVDSAAITSWYPYFYRVKAIGANDPANGLLSGESEFSNVQTGYVLPSGPPALASFATLVNTTGIRITLVTDLPAAAASPVGPALVEVLSLTTSSTDPKPVTTVVLSAAPETIAVGVLNLPVPLPVILAEPALAPTGAPEVAMEDADAEPSPAQAHLAPNFPVTLPPVGKLPISPVLPVAPVSPIQPTHPIVPIPISPVIPVLPVLPIKPVQPVGPVQPVLPIKPIPLPLPHPLPPPPPVPSLRRSVPDANGNWTLYVMAPYTAAQQNTFMIRLTDPLGRRTVKSF